LNSILTATGQVKHFVGVKTEPLLPLFSLLVSSCCPFSDNDGVSGASQAAECQVLVASPGRVSGITVVYHTAEEKKNGPGVESCSGYLGSLSVCGVPFPL
jgi:hypothetical protein